MVLLDWLKDPFLGSEVTMADALLALGLIVLGILISLWVPNMISKWTANAFNKLGERPLAKIASRRKREVPGDRARRERLFKATLELPLRRALKVLCILLFLALAVYSLDMGLTDTFHPFKDGSDLGPGYEYWRLLQISIITLILLAISFLAVEPVLRGMIYTFLGQNISRPRKYRLFKAVRVPIKVLVILGGFYIGMVLSFTANQMEPFSIVIKFILVIILVLLIHIIAQVVVGVIEPHFAADGGSSKGASKSVSRLLKVGIYALGAFMVLYFLGIPLTTIFASSVIIGLVLGFGLQDTIGNFAAGIMITIDKPFVIGDRIRINWGGVDTWGDVKDISLRSTWIRTPEDELIVVPNHVIAASQVWNYTRGSPRVAVTFDLGISYGSDWRLAEKLILEILSEHPLALKHPPFYVMMKEFGDSAQVLTVWVWVSEARDKLVIRSDILKRIKDSFDRNGVEIPFPYRTLVYQKDLPAPKRLREKYESPIYLPSMGFQEFRSELDFDRPPPRTSTIILAPTSSSYPATFTAPRVMEYAMKMDASVVALFIKTPGRAAQDGQKALRIYSETARKFNVNTKLVFKEGDVLENILSTVDAEGVTMVIMGSTEESLFGSITKRSISQELLLHLSIPMMVIPFSKEQIEPSSRAETPVPIGPDAPPIHPEGIQPDFSSIDNLEKLNNPQIRIDRTIRPVRGKDPPSSQP